MIQLAPKLLGELMKTATRPRAPHGYGYFRPTMAILELSQSLTQAVPLSCRKVSEKGSTGDSGLPSLLQLPHMDTEVIKRLGRKKVRGLMDLLGLNKEARAAALGMAGLTEAGIADLESALETVPLVCMAASCATEGEEGGVMEGDIVTCSLRVNVARFGAKESGGGVGLRPEFAPFYPFPRSEEWWAMLADPATNALLIAEKVELKDMPYLPDGEEVVTKHLEADSRKALALIKEKEAKRANKASEDPEAEKAEKDQESEEEEEDAVVEASEDIQEDATQLITIRFQAPQAATYNFQAVLMSDFWIGCDRKVNIKLKVGKRSRSDREIRGMGPMVSSNGQVWSESDEEDMVEGGEDDEEEYDEDEESGTEESGSDDDDDDAQSSNKK